MPRGRPKKNQPKELELAEMIQESAEFESEEVELVPVEQVEVMSMTQLQEEKQKLAVRRNEVMLKLDGRRLDQSIKLMDAMDVALDKMINQCAYDEDGNPVELSAMDFKFYSDAYKNLSNSLQIVSRLDSVDTGGKAGRINIKIEYG